MAGQLKLNLPGFRELRTSREVTAWARGKAEQVAAAAGDEFTAKQAPSKNRARFVIVPDSAEAALETAREPAKFIGSLNAARG